MGAANRALRLAACGAVAVAVIAWYFLFASEPEQADSARSPASAPSAVAAAAPAQGTEPAPSGARLPAREPEHAPDESGEPKATTRARATPDAAAARLLQGGGGIKGAGATCIVRGRIVANGALPAANTRVRLCVVETLKAVPRSDKWSFHAPQRGELREQASNADGDGRFEFRGVAPGLEHVLAVDAGGPRATSSLQRGPLLFWPGTTNDLGDIVIEGEDAVAGRVLDAGGAPVSGALVMIAAARPERMPPGRPVVAVVVGAMARWRVDDSARGWHAWADVLLSPRAVTDASGSYLLRGVQRFEGPGDLIVTHPDHAPLVAARPRPPRGGYVDAGELRLEAGAALAGRVTYQGAPVRGASIHAGHLGEGWSGGLVPAVSARTALLPEVARTGLDGTFQARGLPADGHLIAVRSSEPDVDLVLDRVVVPGGQPLAIELPLPVDLEVALVDRESHAISGAAVELRYVEVAVGSTKVLSPASGALAGREIRAGTYLWTGLVPGPAVVSARAEGFAERRADVLLAPGRGQLVMELARAAACTLTITDGATGRPVSGAAVLVAFGERIIADARTGADGIATLEQGANAELTAEVSAAGFVAKGVIVPRGSTVVKVVLQAAGAIRGRLHLPADADGAGWWVAVLGASERIVARAEVDSSGSFALAGVPPGQIDVVAFQPRQGTASGYRARVAVTAGEEASVEIEIQP